MNRRAQLLRMIQKYDFALYDLMLYLDTHNSCREALALFRKYREQREKAVKEYTSRFGSLQADQQQSEQEWEWGKGPYPWEKEAN